MKHKKPINCPELICINVDKVYDWIVKEKSFDVTSLADVPITFTPADSVPDEDIVGATVTCEVNPDPTTPIEVLARDDRPFIIDGTQVTLQQLNIRKNFIITLIVTLADGTVLTSAPPVEGNEPVNAELLISRCEQVTLCAPVGTEVEITYTDLDCFVCTTGALEVAEDTISFTALTISVITCQSIQSIYPVTVEFLAEFCEPRDDIQPECPAPIRPLQCPVVFP
ncbi:BMQ_0737 family morphogenetic spore coat protein [Paenisporosarcina antarctica]|uniref:DUF3794 domain-containing protein n=1 Tax=Paenisporosarcina antarctica TaxID=417367 RepID=A0A4V1AMQ3_9BACL|nr:hypothetical protein [Paenisporosarcina antarctica]QBP40075.1 hypothetical protein E2636_02410 [Paenisporosarcina antarctica]